MDLLFPERKGNERKGKSGSNIPEMVILHKYEGGLLTYTFYFFMWTYVSILLYIFIMNVVFLSVIGYYCKGLLLFFGCQTSSWPLRRRRCLPGDCSAGLDVSPRQRRWFRAFTSNRSTTSSRSTTKLRHSPNPCNRFAAPRSLSRKLRRPIHRWNCFALFTKEGNNKEQENRIDDGGLGLGFGGWMDGWGKWMIASRLKMERKIRNRKIQSNK